MVIVNSIEKDSLLFPEWYEEEKTFRISYKGLRLLYEGISTLICVLLYV